MQASKKMSSSSTIRTALAFILVVGVECRIGFPFNNNAKEKEVIPIGEICPQDWPPSHAMLHDRRQDVVHDFEETTGKETDMWNGRFDDTPELAVRHNVRYSVWHGLEHHVYSVWDPENVDDYVGKDFRSSSGWCRPTEKEASQPVKEVLEGDWAAFSTWHNNVYGHFVHDHLPTIAYLKSSVPESTKFLLVDYNVTRMVIEQVDPVFYKRIKWINERDVYHVQGSLTVALRLSYEITMGCCGAFDPLRKWLAEAHPYVPDKKIVLYYQRRSKDTTNGRVLDEAHEAEVLRLIRSAMNRYHTNDEELVIFNGLDPKTGDTMSIADQFALFRRARTIIGPHGSGIGGNFAWTNPFPTNCEERTQLLEFLPGKETPDVHNHPYVTHYNTVRKWPLDYHNILYTAESTSGTTFVNLQDLDDALRFMWGGGDASLKSVYAGISIPGQFFSYD